jgi:NADPH-dependent 2,4-dienoyl-CoA reductase/sulfur reductase-like enzyme
MNQYDVIVVGAGPAGIAAATAAARSGGRVLLLDENPAPGGQIWRTGMPAQRHRSGDGERARSRALEQLNASGVSFLFGYSVYDAPTAGELRAICESAIGAREDLASREPMLVSLGYRKLVLATGARERFLPFPGWTLPGVFGLGGLQALVKGGLDVQGKRIVVAGSGPLLLAVAAHLRGYGASVVCVAEQAQLSQMLPFAVSLWSHPGKIMQGIRYRAALRSAPFHIGCWPVAALADEVSGKLIGVQLTEGKNTWEEACDLVACGFHLVPNTELASLLGCVIKDGLVKVDEKQQTSIQNVFCAGEPTGIGGLSAALLQGEIAGLACAEKSVGHLQRRRRVQTKFVGRLAAAFQLRPELRSLASPDTLVCRCEDVSFAALESRGGWIDAKLQTRCGMGPCQGRICGAATDFLFGWKQVSVRPPLTPVPVSALSSQHFRPMDIKENL